MLAHLALSVRKEIKIRPGFTPQEDVSRFRGTRQQAMDSSALPKGHILGWIAPSAESQPKAKVASDPPPNKNAKKRANQRARKAAEKSAEVRDNWEDDDDVESSTTPKTPASDKAPTGKEGTDKGVASQGEDEITDKLSKLEVK